MPVLVDCRKRDASIFLDDPFTDSLYLSKRIRRSDADSSQLSPPPTPLPSAASVSHGGAGGAMSSLDLLRARFPELDNKLVERVLGVSGNNLETAIESLNKLRSESQRRDLDSSTSKSSVPIVANVPLPSEADGIDNVPPVPLTAQTCKQVGKPQACFMVSSSGGPATISNLPADGSGWVELLLGELTNACGIDDAKTRVSRVLESLQKAIIAYASAEATESLGKENKKRKDQVEALLRDNGILKRAVAIQHERQKTYDAQNEELQHLKQMVVQYKEQLKTLEFNNYALGMQLKEAQKNSSIPGRFHPDVF